MQGSVLQKGRLPFVVHQGMGLVFAEPGLTSISCALHNLRLSSTWALDWDLAEASVALSPSFSLFGSTTPSPWLTCCPCKLSSEQEQPGHTLIPSHAALAS